MVKRVKPGGPCEGVLDAGDRVLAFDGESNDWFTIKDVARLTMGMLDTEVRMYICICIYGQSNYWFTNHKDVARLTMGMWILTCVLYGCI